MSRVLQCCVTRVNYLAIVLFASENSSELIIEIEEHGIFLNLATLSVGLCG